MVGKNLEIQISVLQHFFKTKKALGISKHVEIFRFCFLFWFDRFFFWFATMGSRCAPRCASPLCFPIVLTVARVPVEFCVPKPWRFLPIPTRFARRKLSYANARARVGVTIIFVAKPWRISTWSPRFRDAKFSCNY